MIVMEESGDSILDLVTNASYCPANVSLASIKRGEISACFIDTVINPLLILVAAAAGKKEDFQKIFKNDFVKGYINGGCTRGSPPP